MKPSQMQSWSRCARFQDNSNPSANRLIRNMGLAKALSISAALTILLMACQQRKPSHTRLLSDHVPTETPTVFAPGVISTEGHVEGSIVFNPEMTELFFQRRKSGESHNIYTMKLINGEWTKPALTSFSQNKAYLDLHPRLSPDGHRLYFGSTRPLPDSTKSSGLHQWYVERNDNEWGEPQLLLPAFLKDEWTMCVTPSEKGNLYFTYRASGEKMKDEGIYYAVTQGDHYGAIQSMGPNINGDGNWIAHPFVASDESYVLYDAERTTIPENGDLYITFKQDDAWSESYSLGPDINTEISEGAATVSPDGKYLFFSRGSEKTRADGSTYWTGNIYWVDFEKLKRRLFSNVQSH